MKLVDYLAKESLSCREFSRMVGVSHTTITNIISGKRCFPKTAKRIEIITEGAVKADDILALEPWLRVDRYA